VTTILHVKTLLRQENLSLFQKTTEAATMKL